MSYVGSSACAFLLIVCAARVSAAHDVSNVCSTGSKDHVPVLHDTFSLLQMAASSLEAEEQESEGYEAHIPGIGDTALITVSHDNSSVSEVAPAPGLWGGLADALTARAVQVRSAGGDAAFAGLFLVLGVLGCCLFVSVCAFSILERGGGGAYSGRRRLLTADPGQRKQSPFAATRAPASPFQAGTGPSIPAGSARPSPQQYAQSSQPPLTARYAQSSQPPNPPTGVSVPAPPPATTATVPMTPPMPGARSPESPLPPPLCAALVLPHCEARFAVSYAQVVGEGDGLDARNFELLGLSGKSLLRATVDAQSIAVSMMPANCPALGFIGALDSRGVMELRDAVGRHYGDLVASGPSAYRLLIDPTGPEALNIVLTPSHLVISGPGGMNPIAWAARCNESDFFAGVDHLEIRVSPRVDAVLVLCCVFGIVLFGRMTLPMSVAV